MGLGKHVLPQEPSCQVKDVWNAPAQRRQSKANHIEAIKEIGAKPLFGDFFLEPDVGNRNNSGPQRLHLVRAQRLENAFLDRTGVSLAASEGEN